jgi:hypothetical protein
LGRGCELMVWNRGCDVAYAVAEGWEGDEGGYQGDV